jgi:hypothetical protein
MASPLRVVLPQNLDPLFYHYRHAGKRIRSEIAEFFGYTALPNTEI